MSEQKQRNISRRGLLSAAVASGGAMALGLGGARSAEAARRRPLLEGKRVLVAIGEFAEGLETYYMVYRLMEEGAEVQVIAPTKKRLQMVVHDFEPQYEGYTEKLGYQINVDRAFADVDAKTYDALLVPGGRAPEEIRQNADLVRIVAHFLEAKKPLGAMCHGVMLIYTAGPIKRREMTAYPGIRKDIELLGGTFLDQPVVVDGPMVTSRGWPDLPYFMPRFIDTVASDRYPPRDD